MNVKSYLAVHLTSRGDKMRRTSLKKGDVFVYHIKNKTVEFSRGSKHLFFVDHSKKIVVKDDKIFINGTVHVELFINIANLLGFANGLVCDFSRVTSCGDEVFICKFK